MFNNEVNYIFYNFFRIKMSILQLGKTKSKNL